MNKVALIDLQRQFLAQMRGLPGSDASTEMAIGRMPVDTGLGIYAHAYGARLREALGKDHPVLGMYLGDALWELACDGFISAVPSRHRSLRNFGDYFPAHLTRDGEFAENPEIAELAALERHLLDSFDAADGERADWAQLQATEPASWPGLHLRFHPSLMLHRVAFNSVEIWQALKDGHPPPVVAVAGSRAWAIWRDEQRITRFRSLDEEEDVAVTHFLLGGDFAGLCELLMAWHPMEAVPGAALGHLRCWCSEEWISRWV